MARHDAFIERNGQTVTLPDNSTTKMIFDERPETAIKEFGSDLGEPGSGRVAVAYAKPGVSLVNDTKLTSQGKNWIVQRVRSVTQGDTVLCQTALLTINGGVS